MSEKNTGELENEIARTEDLKALLAGDGLQAGYPTAAEFLQSCLQRRGLEKKEFVRQAVLHGLSREYCYEILRGGRQKKHAKDMLVALALLLGLGLEDTQHLLKYADSEELYARDRRDAVLIFGLTHGRTLAEINSLLEQFGFASLISAPRE